MKKLLKWLLLLTGVLAIGITAILYKPGLVKGPLENYLSQATGYYISLEGELEIDAGMPLVLSAADINVFAPRWAENRNLATLGSISLVLDTASVFEDVIVIESLQIDKLNLYTETNEDGKANWEPVITTQTRDDEHDAGSTVLFRDIKLSNANIHYLEGESGDRHELHIESLDQHQADDGMLRINLDGALNERPVEYAGNIGPYQNLLQGRDISFMGEGHFGSLEVSGNGLIDDLIEPRKPQFTLDLQGPDVDEITSMLGVDDLGSGGFSLRANGEEINGLYTAGIDGQVGDVSLIVSATASDLAKLNEVDLTLSANGPNLGSLTRVFGIDDWPDQPFKVDADIKRVGTTLNVSNLLLSIGGARLLLDGLLADFPSLAASRAKLSLTGNDIAEFRTLLGIKGIATGPFEVHGNLNVSPDGVEHVQARMTSSLGQATISGTLGPPPSHIGTRLNIHMDGHDAHGLISAFGINALPQEPFVLDARVELSPDGLMIERGVVATIGDDQLELGGLLALDRTGKGSEIELNVSGQDLAQMLRLVVGGIEFPDKPYDLSTNIQVRGAGIELRDIEAGLDGIRLAAEGLLKPGDGFTGTNFDFQVEGENLSSLKNFPVIEDYVTVFSPGQAYSVTGRLAADGGTWQLEQVHGQVGTAMLELDGLVNPQGQWQGSRARFSVKGPDLHSLFANDESYLPPGEFEVRAEAVVSSDKLNVKDFTFESDWSHAMLDLELGWPVTDSTDVAFEVHVWGDDIRHFLPRINSFEPAKAAYEIKTTGQRQGNLLSLQYFNAEIGGLYLSLSGSEKATPEDDTADIAIRGNSKDISTLGRLYGKQLPMMALDLSADFRGTTSQFVVENLTGSLGESRLEGAITASLAERKPQINLTANSSYLDLRPFLELIDPDEESQPETIAKDQADTPDRARLIPPTPLPLDAMNALNGNFNISIDELRMRNDSLRNIAFEVKLSDGALALPRFMVEGSRGKITSSLSIRPTSYNMANVQLDLSAEQFVFNLTGQPKDKLDQVPRVDLELHASGAGRDLQELAGSINGSIQLGSTGGVLENVSLSLLDTFILEEVLKLIMPKTEDSEDLKLSCAAAILSITDGVMKTDPAYAFTTSKISLIAKGSIDLKTEKMHINFNAIPNNVLQISPGELFNPYILVGGTLAKPSIGLDPAKTLLFGGVAVGTGGLSILAKGVLDRIRNTESVCETMLKKME